MIKFILFVTLFFTGLITAQVTENREVADFSKLKASSGIQVFYTVSNTKSVKVETDDVAKMQYIKTEVDGETLKLYIENTGKSKNKKWNNGISFKVLKITISGPNLNEIKASSSAFIKIQSWNKTDDLQISVSSSGTIKGNFECNTVNIQASSSGEFIANVVAKATTVASSSSSTVTLEGKSTDLNCSASSSGDCNLKEFKVENAIASASSSGSITVNTSKSIEAKASSSGSISFFGNPTNVSKEMSSSGSISKK